MRFIIALLLTLVLATNASAQVGVLKNTTITANGQTVTLKLDPVESLGVSVDNSGTYGLAFEASMDNGQTYFAVGLVDSSDYTVDTTTSGAGKWWFANLGMTHFRVRATSYSSGAPVVKFVRGYGGITAPLSAGAVSGANSAAGATGSAVPASASYTGLNVGGTHRGWTGISLGSHYAGTMAIVDGSGNQITSFGGGTQYTEADTDTTITGTAVMFESNTGTSALSVVSNSAPLPVSDAGGSVTVDNGGTFAVQAAQSGTWNVTNISGTVSLPTGAATSANQSTQITSLQLIDNMPITIGSTTSGQSGVLNMGAVTTSAPTYTNAQSAPLSLTTGGLLRVAIEAGAGSGGTAMADDAAFTVGTTSVTPVGYLLDDSATDTINEGDIGAPRMSSNRVPFAQIRDAAGNERGANVNASNQLSVSVDALASNESDDGTIAASLTSPRVIAQLYGFDGTNWVRASTNADPCSGGAKVFVAISQTASTQLLTGTSSNRTYVCSVVLSQPSASTQTFSLVSGTGTTCGTGTAAMIGATSAANGMQIPFSAGSGAGSVAKSGANADNVCLLQSSTDRIAGVLSYVVAP